MAQATRGIPPTLRPWLLAGAVFLVEFGCFHYPLWQPSPVVSLGLWLLGGIVVPFALSFLGLRAYVVVLPGLLALVVSTGVYLIVMMSGEDSRWWPMALVARVPIAVVLGILLAVMYPLGKEARKAAGRDRQRV